MNRSYLLPAAVILVLLLVFTGCVQKVARSTTPTPTTPLATAFPTSTPSPMPTGTPTPTRPSASPIPTSTPSPTPITTPAPSLFLEVRGPADGTTVQVGAVVVHGATTPGATATINGKSAFVDREGKFQAEIALLPGNNAIQVIAQGPSGNQVRKVVNVSFQAPSPQPFFLVITQPQDQSILSTSSIPLKGQTAPEAIVSVNGVGVEVDQQGSFSTVVTLTPGPNVIEVVATNPDGRTLSTVVAVIFRP